MNKARLQRVKDSMSFAVQNAKENNEVYIHVYPTFLKDVLETIIELEQEIEQTQDKK